MRLGGWGLQCLQVAVPCMEKKNETKGNVTDTVAHRTEHKLLNAVFMPYKFLKYYIKSNGKSNSTNIHLGRALYLRGKFTMACRWQIIPISQYTYSVNINGEIYITYV